MKKEILEYSGNAKDYLYALINYPNFIRLIEPKDKTYKVLHDWLLAEIPNIQGSDKPIHIKEIAKQLKLDSNKVSKMIIELYNDILLLNEQEPSRFYKQNEFICTLDINYMGRIKFFQISLKCIPRIGDIFQFQFLKPKLGGDFFYVRELSHEIKDEGHIINIYLKDEMPNKYIALLKDKAYLYNYIDINEYLLLGDIELAEMFMKWNVRL
jgi:hypothetical protein